MSGQHRVKKNLSFYALTILFPFSGEWGEGGDGGERPENGGFTLPPPHSPSPDWINYFSLSVLKIQHAFFFH